MLGIRRNVILLSGDNAKWSPDILSGKEPEFVGFGKSAC